MSAWCTPGMYVYLSFLVFAFGACIGSFLNVCIHRIPLDQSVIHPRSHCPRCSTPIAWFDNLPIISFFALRGRCRHCQQPISPRYALVEMLVGLLFFLVWYQYGFDIRTPVYWLVIAGLVLGTFVDFEHMIIPDRVSLGGIAAGLLLSFLVPSLHGQTRMVSGLIDGVTGVLAGSGSLWLVGVLGKMAFKKDAMGLGDVKLLGAIGAFLGWQAVVFTIMLSSLAGASIGIGLILFGRKEWQSRLPYGPYLALGAIIWILWGFNWWQLYMEWISGGGL
jgi:leader peptidase (prepilin peptidase)/N-methyltransferase